MRKSHNYPIQLDWTGNLGQGTSGYMGYSRNHEFRVAGKPVLPGSSDPHFRGDPARYNPEELLVASLSACHMLWYLHLASDAGIVVSSYTDEAEGTMVETEDGGGHFTRVVLRPRVRIREAGRAEEALALHQRAHHLCFIANSVNFPVECEGAVD